MPAFEPLWVVARSRLLTRRRACTPAPASGESRCRRARASVVCQRVHVLVCFCVFNACPRGKTHALRSSWQQAYAISSVIRSVSAGAGVCRFYAAGL